MKNCKKITAAILAITLLATSFCFFSCDKDNVNTNAELKEFGSQKSFITYCDRPPTPTMEHLEIYKAAGFSHYLMTEDDYKFTDDKGNITAEYLQGLKNCEDLGLDVLIRNYYADPDYFVNNDDSVRVYDTVTGPITYSIPKRNITDELTKLSVVKGYYMADEPSYNEIDRLSAIVDWYNAYGGETLFHVNLNSSYGQILFPENTWEEYLDKFIEVILKKVNGPKTLSIDYYPMRETNTGVKYIYEDFLYNVMTIAEKTVKFNETIENEKDKALTTFCVQAYKEPDVREISCAEEISFQINIYIAFGAKNLEYYMYRGMPDSTSMVECVSQQPRDLYYYVQEANKELNEIAKSVLDFEYVAAKTYKGTQLSDDKNGIAMNKVKDKTDNAVFSILRDAECRLDTVITEMKDEDGNKAYMVVNYSEPTMRLTDSVILKFKNANKAVVYINGEYKTIELIEGEAELEIGAGKAAFVYPVCN